MKRATGYKISAGAFQLHMTIDHIDNIDAVKQILDERLRNHGENASIRRGSDVRVYCRLTRRGRRRSGPKINAGLIIKTTRYSRKCDRNRRQFSRPALPSPVRILWTCPLAPLIWA